MMFHSNKGEQYYSVRYKSEFARFLKSSERELRIVHDAYPNDYVAREVNAHLLMMSVWPHQLWGGQEMKRHK